MMMSSALGELPPASYEEEFYESLDRIFSSSCSSTSASDDDTDYYHCHRFSPPAAAAYEVWITDPAPVEERRRRLLQMLGLTGDPALSRSKSPISNSGEDDFDRWKNGDCGEAARSASYKAVYQRIDPFSSSALFTRSRSDGTVDSITVQRQLRFSPSIWPVVSDGIVRDEDDDDDDPRCTIRNLDTGRKFVVKEFREDGMWNKLREVGTGRQLTMEEFEMCVGRSPIVHELMRRQNQNPNSCAAPDSHGGGGQFTGGGMGVRVKRKGNWLRSIKSIADTVVHYREKRSIEERDSSSEKGGRRSSSATDDSQEGSNHNFHGTERIRVKQYGKSLKELSGLYLTQEIQAHSGSIWTIEFSLNGQYLASAGEDCVIHIWQVLQCERKGFPAMEGAAGENGSSNPFLGGINNGTPEVAFALACIETNHWEKKRRTKITSGRKSLGLETFMVPEHLFALEERPLCSFRGHLDDILDLSWSKSQYLLSSSMDKTVRLWHMSSISCLKIFSHSDYVTCIQFNPVDDRYFISGSLDEKIRIWSIPDQRVVDWNDLHEMVTAACYTPDGQGALVGSHKGSCHLYDTSDNKLHHKTQIELQNKKRKSNNKKITGFQFSPGSNSEVLITSADSRIRVVDGVELILKLKGFRNTSSQISASVTQNGKYVICASEDSHIYVWKHDTDPRPTRSKVNINTRQTYEHFHCRDVTAAIPWINAAATTYNTPGETTPHGFKTPPPPQPPINGLSQNSKLSLQLLDESNGHESIIDSLRPPGIVGSNTNQFGDRASATWPEEKLVVSSEQSSPESSTDRSDGGIHLQSKSAWGMVIVAATRGGRIRTFQNFGFPVRV
ncbi:WD repeat-containing protein 44-like [Phalaenopsis equestris]|uniref:WD repeat-containing protein 44-like n=1 Tax=Phalaenopsis equestris TaxID=78828 RepID=UPI0009E3B5C4|nr:WD repeat-containing protein 44-like [Phalaenopsis equestris]